MKSLAERQKERALRKVASAKGEDISSQLETQDLIDAKDAAVQRVNESENDEFVPPQYAVGPVREAPQVAAHIKTVVDRDGNEVDGDPANKKKPSEKVSKVSTETQSTANKVAKAAEQQQGWTANVVAQGGGGGNGGESPKK